MDMEKEAPQRPSRRPHPWRWAILFSRFFWAFIALGTFKSFGIFIPQFVSSFRTTTAVAGVVSSLTLGFGLFVTGPFIGALLKIWDARRVTMTGGALAGVSLFVASFSTGMGEIAACLASMSIGIAMVQVAAVKPIMDYFPDSFATANGVSLAGGTVGMMVLPLLVDRLVFVYGWRSALGLVGAFSLNYIACGAMLRPLPGTELAKYARLSDGASSRSSSKPMSDKDRLLGSDEDRPSLAQRLAEMLRDRFDTRLLGEPIFVVYQAVNVLNGVIYSSWHLFLIPQGLELGYGAALSALLATFGGLGALVGRLGHGSIVDRQLMRSSTLMAASTLLFAAANLTNPLALSSYGALAALAFVSGIAIGAIYPLSYVLMREIIGDRHTSAYGWLFLSHGGGQVIGGFLSGWIHDVTGAYEFVFVILGGLAVPMAVILVSTRCLLTCCEPDE